MPAMLEMRIIFTQLPSDLQATLIADSAREQACQLSVAIRWIENGGPRTHKSSELKASKSAVTHNRIGKKW